MEQKVKGQLAALGWSRNLWAGASLQGSSVTFSTVPQSTEMEVELGYGG